MNILDAGGWPPCPGDQPGGRSRTPSRFMGIAECPAKKDEATKATRYKTYKRKEESAAVGA